MALVQAIAAPAQVRSSASTTILAPAGPGVVLEAVSQTDMILTLAGGSGAIAMISRPLPQIGSSEGTRDIGLPATVSMLIAPTAPDAVMMSLGSSGEAEQGRDDTMVVVVQFN